MTNSFFALKFHEGDKDRAKVEAIEKALNKAGISITVMVRDVEKWGKAKIPVKKVLDSELTLGIAMPLANQFL